MAVEPIQPANLNDVPTAQHQTLLDRFYGLFNGAFQYIDQHLPEHDLKDEVLKNVKAGWDNAAKVIKDDLSKVLAAGQVAVAQAAPEVISAVEDAAKTVVTDASQTVQSVAADVTGPTVIAAPVAEVPAPPVTPPAA